MLDLALIGTPAFSLEVRGDTFHYSGMNARLEELTGLEGDRLIGMTPYSCLPSDAADAVVARYRQCVETREAIEYEAYYELPGGGRWWSVAVTPVIDHGQKRVTALLGIAVDITRRRAAEIASEEAAARLALAMDVIDGGFWHLDVPTREFLTSVPLASLVAGNNSPALGLDDYLSYVVEEDRPAADLSALMAGFKDESVAEYRVKTFAGETKWMRCQRRLIRDENCRPRRIVGVAIDVTEQKMLQARYRHQATTDMLTGLANRRSLTLRAQELILDSHGTGRRFGLILLDLDHFKPVNDRYGHAAGDIVLQQVATRLVDEMRDQDLVARFGGDEFAIIIEDVDEGLLPQICNRVSHVLTRPFVFDGTTVRLGASLGGTISDRGDKTLDDLVLRADRDLYRAKDAGRHRWTPTLAVGRRSG